MNEIVIILLSAVIAIITAYVTASLRLRTDLRTQFMAERAVKKVLQHPEWTQRTFDQIERKVGGFEPNDLRKLLVRAGAVRFYNKDKVEYWGLLERNEVWPEAD